MVLKHTKYREVTTEEMMIAGPGVKAYKIQGR